MKPGYLNTMVSRVHPPAVEAPRAGLRTAPVRRARPAPRGSESDATPQLKETSIAVAPVSEGGEVQVVAEERQIGRRAPAFNISEQSRASIRVIHAVDPNAASRSASAVLSPEGSVGRQRPAIERDEPRGAAAPPQFPRAEQEPGAAEISRVEDTGRQRDSATRSLKGRSENGQANRNLEPEFRMVWPMEKSALPVPVLNQAKRELLRAAKEQWAERTRSGAVTAQPPVVDIRVDHLTVRVENNTAAAPPPVRSTRSTASDDGFSPYFLRRSFSGW